MTIHSRLVAIGLACAVLGAATPASAVVLTWTLEDVTFVDGGTATGMFAYDTDAKKVSDWDITTTTGTTTAGAHYQKSTGTVQSELFGLHDNMWFLPSVGGYFYLHFAGPLTAAGGTVDLLTVTSPVGSIENVRAARAVKSGSATAAVPEPSTWALMLVGFGAAGSALRRRARKSVPAENAIIGSVGEAR